MTREELIQADFDEIPVPILEEGWASKFFQKRISDEKGIKYFINIFFSRPFGLYDTKVIIQVQFTRQSDTFNLEIFDNPKHTVKDMEEIVERFWRDNSFDYYEKFE